MDICELAFISSEIMLHGSSAYAETHGRYEQYVLKGSQRRVQGAAEPKLLPVLGISNQFTATDKKESAVAQQHKFQRPASFGSALGQN